MGPGRHRGGPETGPRHVVDLAPAPAARRAGRSPGRASHTETGGTSYGLLDGASWPRLRDLLRELPSWSDVLDPLGGGRITRIAVNSKRWTVMPSPVPVDGRIAGHPYAVALPGLRGRGERATVFLHRAHPGTGWLRTVRHTARGLCCCADVPDPGGILLLNADDCWVRTPRLSPGASLEGTGWAYRPATQAVGPAVALPPPNVRPVGSAPKGPGPRRHSARCRMVFRTEATCSVPSSPCTAMSEGIGR
ncbi:DUF5994 family protein [Streptomyces sp. NPDC060053]|uniref:DUF5994 family protein n=1 Tax=Streptomyces sp. NPDC060053 TaxID=3347047 RepID=UPI0036810FC5